MTAIKVNADEWNDLSEQERKNIVSVLTACGVMADQDIIVPDPKEPKSEETDAISSKSICKLACEAWAIPFRAACNTIPIAYLRRKCLKKIDEKLIECQENCK